MVCDPTPADPCVRGCAGLIQTLTHPQGGSGGSLKDLANCLVDSQKSELVGETMALLVAASWKQACSTRVSFMVFAVLAVVKLAESFFLLIPFAIVGLELAVT